MLRTADGENIKLQLPRLEIGSLVLDAVVVVGVVDVGDGADLHLPTFLWTKPRALEADHVGTVIFVKPGPEQILRRFHSNQKTVNIVEKTQTYTINTLCYMSTVICDWWCPAHHEVSQTKRNFLKNAKLQKIDSKL